MVARWWTFGVWALVAGSAFFWGLRIFVQAPAAPPDTLVAQPGGDLRGDLTRLFGVDAPPPPPAAAEAAPPPDPRFTLVGVVSPRSAAAAREGVALIAIDGNPAKAYRVGMVVDGNTVLQAVQARGALLGPRGAPASVTLELPPLPPPATGTLPSIGGGDATQPPGMGRPVMPGGARPMPAPPGTPGYSPALQGQQMQDMQQPQVDSNQADMVPQLR
jgi:general secretion pathway protein C